MKSILYAGTFNIPTNGHVDVVRRAVDMFGGREIVVGIGKNHDKSYSDFSVKERTDMFKKSMSVYPELRKVKVKTFEGSLAGYAYENMATVLKGVRDCKDFEYEKNQFEALEMQELGVDTVFLPARKDMTSVASSYVKGLQMASLPIEKLVHPYVKQCVEGRISGQYIVGVTGEVGAGKSTVCKKLQKIAKNQGLPVHVIDMDKIPHGIYDGTFKEPIYGEIRKQMVKEFGPAIEMPDGKINRKALGEIVFNDDRKLQKLNEIVYKPMMTKLRRDLSSKKGLVIVEAALAAEMGMTYLSNNNYVLVSADKESQKRRLRDRELDDGQIKRRIESHITTEMKRDIMQGEIDRSNHGKVWEVCNSDGYETPLADVLDDIVKDVDQYGQLRFAGMWNRIGADGTPDREYDRLVKTYLEPSRVYHSLPHIVSGLGEIDEVKDLMDYPDQVRFAWFYHDYMQRRGSRINEDESAKVAYNVCKEARLSDDFASGVRDLVIATKYTDGIPRTEDQEFIKDVDLSILGKPQDEFDAYDAGIAEEYRNEDLEEYRSGRIRILERFLEKPSIYCTNHFEKKYEAKARENLGRAIAKLKAD